MVKRLPGFKVGIIILTTACVTAGANSNPASAVCLERMPRTLDAELGRYESSVPSGDGSVVAFTTTASRFGVRGAGVFALNRATRAVSRLSGRADDASSPAISADGSVVAFVTKRALVRRDRNRETDVYVRFLKNGRLKLVSADRRGYAARGESLAPAVSGDGMYVAFASGAVEFDRRDAGRRLDVYVANLRTGVVRLVSRSPNGRSGAGDSSKPSMSSDGRFVAFTSEAENLVAGDRNGNPDVFVADMTSGGIRLVDRLPNGRTPERGAYGAQISADGKSVAFESESGELAPNDANHAADVFVHKLGENVPTRVSSGPGGAAGNYGSDSPTINGDGSVIAFRSFAENLTSSELPGLNGPGVYVYDGNAATVKRLSTLYVAPSISQDGRWLTLLETQEAPDLPFVHAELSVADGTSVRFAPATDPLPQSTVIRSSGKLNSRLEIAGTAANADRVEVAIARTGRGGRLTWLNTAGELRRNGFSSLCEPTTWLGVRGLRKWRFRSAKPLPHGRYVVFTRAGDRRRDVIRETPFGDKAVFRFRR